MKIAVGFLVAYDYPLLKHALPQVYADADCIVFGLDKDCRSFSGNPFEVSPEFFEWVKAIDVAEKIIWHRGDFFQPHLMPLEVETFTRNQLFSVLPEKMDWYIQLDSDEYFLDFRGFINWLRSSIFPENPLVKAYWKTLYKKDDDGFYTVGSRTETVAVACRYPVYQNTRTAKNATTIIAPFVVLHQSWARNAEEVWFKINNWGHRDDIHKKEFYHNWLSCNQKNYRYFRHFHPMHGSLWPFLEFVPVQNIGTLIAHYIQVPPEKSATPPLPFWYRGWRKIKRWLPKK
jgi:hypothetical protein